MRARFVYSARITPNEPGFAVRRTQTTNGWLIDGPTIRGNRLGGINVARGRHSIVGCDFSGQQAAAIVLGSNTGGVLVERNLILIASGATAIQDEGTGNMHRRNTFIVGKKR